LIVASAASFFAAGRDENSAAASWRIAPEKIGWWP
jgi:hypothetical protein